MVTRSKSKAAVSSVDLPPTPPDTADASPIEFTIAEAKSMKGPKLSARTDYTRWRLLDEAGRQTWHYLESDEEVKAWPQSIADKWHLNMPTVGYHLQNISARLTRARVSQTFQLRRHPSIRSRTLSSSSSIFNCLLGIGPANMADLCFYFLAS